MATYLSAERISTALARLADTRAKMATPFDFIVVKRTLALKGATSVAVAESEPAFLKALDEIGSTGLPDRDRAYLNPFAQRQENHGYRPERYRSNGTNSTISGTIWQPVISLSAGKPRQASLTSGHEAALAKLILTSDTSKGLPSIYEVAIWYWRGRDLDVELAGITDETDRLTKLKDRFVELVGLTAGELDAAFSPSLTTVLVASEPTFVPEKPDPQSYLPGAVVSTASAPTPEELLKVSMSLVTALAAKNFVILSGPSGTGKSRSALKLAEALQVGLDTSLQGAIFELVPVGPDWTSPKRILGFRTPFGRERTLTDGTVSNEGYEITDALRLILRASHPDAADVPHFLIFDEMNLSHVERYFAPFLSLMEAGAILDEVNGLSLVSDDDLRLLAEILEDEDTREAAAVKSMVADGRRFTLPRNLFFVGTVNVDETTYMFSPKVLDRAHVLELLAERPSIYLSGAAATTTQDEMPISAAEAVLRRAIDNASVPKTGPTDDLASLSDEGVLVTDIEDITRTIIVALDGAFTLLEPVGFAFGYRISRDVFSYIASWFRAKLASGVDNATVLASWPDALDSAFLQKVLPKLHGNRRSLGDSLLALEAFLAGHDGSSNPPASYTLGAASKVEIDAANKLTLPKAADLPRARRKLRAMHERLVATGYVSFVS